MSDSLQTETVGRSPFASDELTDDAFLGGALQILQPREGYRAGIDPVFLAAAVEAAAGEHVLEAGSGVGVAALCLARRLSGVEVTGVELQEDLVRLADDNAQRNALEGRVTFLQGDLMDPPRVIRDQSWDHVIANPPYYEEGKGLRAPNEVKALSNMAPEAALEAWLDFCLKRLRPRGTLTLVHRADQLSAILRLLGDRVGALRIFPLWPHPGKEAKRVLVSGIKGSRAPHHLLAGMALHEEGRRYSVPAEQILRHGGALDWGGP